MRYHRGLHLALAALALPLLACTANNKPASGTHSATAASNALAQASPVAAASSAPDPRIAELEATVAALQAQLAHTPSPITVTKTITVVTTPPPTPTPSPTPAPPPGGRLGVASLFGTPDGSTKVAVTVNAITDPAISSNQFNAPKGRWVVVDWTVTNRGAKNLDVNPLDFKLQTADGFLYSEGNSAGLPEPALDLGTLAPGDTVRGFVAYDVALGARVQKLIYQPGLSKQLTVVDLSQQ